MNVTTGRFGATAFAAVVIVALTLSSDARVQAAQAEGVKRAADVLPESTLAYVELADLARSRGRFSETALARIFDEPTVSRFLDTGFPALTHLRGQLSAFTGVGWSDFREAFPGDVALAVLDAQSDGKDTRFWLALIADADPANEGFLKVRTALLGAYARASGTVEEQESVGDTRVSAFRKPDGATLLATTTSNRFIAVRGPEPAHTRELMQGLLSNEGPALSQNATHASVVSRGALPGEDVYLYVDLQQLLKALAPEVSHLLDASLKLTGLKGVQAGSLSLRIEPPGIRDQVYLLAPTPRQGFLAGRGEGAVNEADWLRYVPADAVSFSVGSVDLDRSYNLLWELAETVLGSQVSAAHSEVESFEQETGVDIASDLLACLGPEMARFTVYPRIGSAAGRSDSLVVLPVKDAERLKDALATLKRHFEDQNAQQAGTSYFRIRWEEREFDGRPVTRVVIASQLLSIEPSFAFYRDVSVTPPRELFLVALRLQSLQNMLGYVTNRSLPDVRSAEGYGMLRSRLPSTLGGLGYSDLRRKFLAGYGRVVLGASVIQETSGEKLFDPDLAPPADDVARHLFGLVTGLTGDDDGLLFQAYSPMGYATLAAGLATGVTVAVPGALDAQRKSAVEQCQLNLKRIGIELTLYAAEHDGQFPKSLEELRDLVAARTAESELPPDGRWFRCPGRPLASGIGYEYVPGLTLDAPPQTIICYDREGNHHKERNVLFVDGRVRSFRENVFQQLLRNQPPGSDDTGPAP